MKTSVSIPHITGFSSQADDQKTTYKHLKTKSILILLVVFSIFTACRKDYYAYTTVDYSFTIQYPEEYSKQLADNVKINLRNTITGATQEFVSDAQGRVSAKGITPGVYTVTASKQVTAEEAEQLVGIREEIFCNGSIPTLRITESANSEIRLVGSQAGGFVIKEFYYAGSKTPSGTNYLYDGFIEIYNNSTGDLYADSLVIGNTKSASATVYGFLPDKNNVYLAQAWMIPGNGTQHLVRPGESVVIAITAINHKTDPNGNPNSPANLGKGIADFETYFNPTGTNTRDTDNPDVPNMIHQFANTTAGFDWNIGINGAGLILFRDSQVAGYQTLTEPNVSGTTRYLQVPVKAILDGVDCVGNSTITIDKKRIPETVDAGLTFVGSTYSGKSVIRKVKSRINNRAVLMDSNNSSADFIVNDNPTPKTIAQ